MHAQRIFYLSHKNCQKFCDIQISIESVVLSELSTSWIIHRRKKKEIWLKVVWILNSTIMLSCVLLCLVYWASQLHLSPLFQLFSIRRNFLEKRWNFDCSKEFSHTVMQCVWQLSHGLNHWLSTWGKDPGSTGEGNSAVWLEGVQPGCTSLSAHLRADCHGGGLCLEIPF